MKFSITLVSALVVFASNASACPFSDKEQHASNLEQAPVLASQVQSESDETDSELLLLLKKKAQEVSYN